MSLSLGALAAALAASAAPPLSTTDPQSEIVITAQKPADTPASHASITAETIYRTTNAVEVEDTLKYFPSLVVRKRHPGDTQSPIATRTSGVGSSARSLVYADGALLSSLVGNNNTSASPRWGLVTPQEIAAIDILYGPYSAAYPGNSIGAVVNIATRMPDHLEATANAGISVSRFSQYGTRTTLPVESVGATFGDRIGPVSLFLSEDHIASDNQPLTYVTVASPTTGAGVPVTGAFADLGRTGAPIQVIGASGIEHQIEDHLKFKAAIDLGERLRLTYTGGLFLNTTDAGAETYLQGAAGPFYAGTATIAGKAYAVPASSFSNGVYHEEERHWSHALSLAGGGKRLDWQVIGTIYDFAHDEQRIPTAALPGAANGGAGNDTKLDGTGWTTLDAKASWRTDTNRLSAGAHWDRVRLASNRYTLADWINGAPGALNQQSLGRTQTAAIWAEDAWRFMPALTLTLGGRYEWWRASDGVNFSASPAIAVRQPAESADRFSPKATLAWAASKAWTLRASFGEAWRFPTVGELYQVVTSPVAAVPNPNLRPERALSEELALEHHDSGGTARVSLFNESIKDALISQLGPLNGTTTLATFVQNVDRTHARGVEVALDRHDIVPRVDLAGSATYTDATIRADAALPAAVGKRLPQLPRWRASLVGTWRPVEGVALTAAARYASRSFGTIDNSDPVSHTFTGFDGYVVADVRAVFDVGYHYSLAIGVDNLNNDRYFLYHPFPQRTFHADVSWKL